MYFEFTYETLRYLQNEVKEKVKGTCNLIGVDKSGQVKYSCEFDSKGNDLINVKILEEYEFDGKKVNITEINLLAESFITNLQNDKTEILSKTLFILNYSYITNNEYNFIITGNLMKTGKVFNYMELLLTISFLPENKAEKETKNVNCKD